MQLLNYNPDVLSCIANLSNDEVFTPPEVANAMLDRLADAWSAENDGANIWADPTVKFLDPCTKSGIFLREITRRLTDGLAAEIPDLQERVNHILTRQVYGIAITNLTGMLARRSIYCSKWASKQHSVCTAFDDDDGNIWFKRTVHTWADEYQTPTRNVRSGKPRDGGNGRKCAYCKASETQYGRGSGYETHAYAFIHNDDIHHQLTEMFGEAMQFDVVIGNPPYQLSDGGYGKSAAPIYQLFVEKAIELDPRHVVMITPSRWFAGGKGLDEYRKKMLADHRMRALIDYPKLYEPFPGLKIRGGVSYFVWSRDYDGPCSIQTMWDGEPKGPAAQRYLDQFDVLVRYNLAVPILEKVASFNEPTMDEQVSSRKPFGLPTNHQGHETDYGMKQPILLYANQRTDWIDREDISVNNGWIDDWKVYITRVQGTSAATETMFLGRPIIGKPGTACTETYLVAGKFDSKAEADSLASYLRTRFVRFLVSLRKSTQDAAKQVYGFVPIQKWDREWTDEMLYKKYGINDDEIAFIESMVRPMGVE